MKRLSLFLIIVFCILGVVLYINFGVENRQQNPQDEFDRVVKNYPDKKPICMELSEKDKDEIIMLRFNPRRDGNAVILLEQEGKLRVEIWSQKLMTEVMMNGKAHRKRFSGL